MLDNKKISEIKKTHKKIQNFLRKPYHKPRLEELGDLRSLTLGGSPGGGDSSNTGSELP